MNGAARAVDVFRSRRMAVLFALGFSSGLPLMLTSHTLKAWLGTVGVDVDAIGDISAVGLAYTFKFAWAPLLDRWHPPWLGRRRGWMIVLQLGLAAAIAAMGAIDPATDLDALVVLAIAVAFLSASQDVVIDAYTADLLAPAERAAGAGVYVTGYRVAMLISGSLALVLADHLPWRAVYALMAALMAIGVVAAIAAEEPARRDAPRTLRAAITLPFAELFRRLGARGAIAALAFAALYQFGDHFAEALQITFFQPGHGGLGFTLSEIGALNKAMGFVGLLIGAAIGGALVARHGVGRMLVVFGALQAVTLLGYVVLAETEPSRASFAAVVLVDQAAKAMATAAFLGYLMSLCSPAVSATQFALLTSLSSVGQRVFGPLGGPLERAVGWSGFFAVCAATAIPGLVMAWVIKGRSTSPR